MAERVWILGAGFSASLGGPLLADLFSERTEIELFAKYGILKKSNNHARRLAVDLFHGKRSFWRDAEQYLDTLDQATRSETSSQMLFETAKRFADPETIPSVARWLDREGRDIVVAQIACEAKRWMAAECCSFLKDVSLASEKWKPYRQWASGLSNRDAVITFNYDRVVETLIANGNTKVEIVDPRTAKWDTQKCPVFKLHGSVDWKRTNQSPSHFLFDGDHEAAMTSALDQMGIATPGPSKRLAVGVLQTLWESAMDQIRGSRRVAFLGYRFPETDMEAMAAILEALRQTNGKHRYVTTVLGPSVGSEMSVRLRAVLDHGLLNIDQIPMYAQDFLLARGL